MNHTLRLGKEQVERNMKIAKKCMLFVLVFMAWLTVSGSMDARAETVKGRSRNLDWEIRSDGTFTIRGTGDYEKDEKGLPPWYPHRQLIRTAVVNVSGMTSAFGMFFECTNLQSVDLKGFDTSAMKDMGGLFASCSSLKNIDLDGLDTSCVENMESMFSYCTSLESLDLSSLHTENVVNMEALAAGCGRLKNINLKGLNTAKTEGMGLMFAGCSSLTELDLSGFQTGNVKSMDMMFYKCENLKQIDVSSFDTSAVEDMHYMFSGCTRLVSVDLSGFDVGSVKNMSYLFNECKRLESIMLGSFNTRSVTDMSFMFSDCSRLTDIDLDTMETPNVKNMSAMFYGCSRLKSLDLSGFETAGVTTMGLMFSSCSSLTDINLSGFETAGVTDMSYMFAFCDKLAAVDVSGFDTSNVNNMSQMFYGCRNLSRIDLKNFKTAALAEAKDMLAGCSSLKKIILPGSLSLPVDLPGTSVWKNKDGKICTQADAGLTDAAVYVKQNNSGEPEASYDVMSGFTADITEVTANAQGALSVSAVHVDTDGNGGFTADTAGTVWLKVGKSSSRSKASDTAAFQGNGTIYVFVEKNKAEVSRTGTIRLTRAHGAQTIKIPVMQDARNPALTVNAEIKIADQKGTFSNNAFQVKTKETGAYTIEVKNAGWLGVSAVKTTDPARGLSRVAASKDGTFYLVASRNEGKRRSANITVTHSSGKPVRTITVTQFGSENSYLETDRRTADFDQPAAAVSGAVHIMADKNTKWTVETSQKWITVRTTKSASGRRSVSLEGSGFGTFYIRVEKNGGFKQRDGYVKISAPGKTSHKITVSQAANEKDPAALLEELSVSVSNAVFEKGKTSSIRYDFPNGLYASDVKKVRYATSRKKVATVNGDGVIKGIRKGTAVITAQVILTGGESKTFRLKVTVGTRKVTVTEQKQ